MCHSTNDNCIFYTDKTTVEDKKGTTTINPSVLKAAEDDSKKAMDNRVASTPQPGKYILMNV